MDFDLPLLPDCGNCKKKKKKKDTWENNTTSGSNQWPEVDKHDDSYA